VVEALDEVTEAGGVHFREKAADFGDPMHVDGIRRSVVGEARVESAAQTAKQRMNTYWLDRRDP
jgi:hypothetical protein